MRAMEVKDRLPERRTGVASPGSGASEARAVVGRPAARGRRTTAGPSTALEAFVDALADLCAGLDAGEENAAPS